MNKRIGSALLSVWLTMAAWSALMAQTNTQQPGGELSPEAIEEYKQQAQELVSFLEYMMNFLGDPKATTQQKETIITQSYLKAFRDEDVQVEDDRVFCRLVPEVDVHRVADAAPNSASVSGLFVRERFDEHLKCGDCPVRAEHRV